MHEIFRYSDATGDRLEIDVLIKERHGHDAMMFTTVPENIGERDDPHRYGISVIMDLDVVHSLIAALLIELDVINNPSARVLLVEELEPPPGPHRPTDPSD